MTSTINPEPSSVDTPAPTREWVQVDVRTTLDAGELLGLLNDPAVTGAWQEADRLHLYWPADSCGPDSWWALRQAAALLGHPLADEDVLVNRVADQDWNARWAESVEPIRIGRMVIRPSWKTVELGADEIELVIDPKQAFGTGHHATTHLLIAWLQEIVTPADRVLDVGTGSGILAMTALRCGAASARGVDVDPVAVDCARDYARVNGFDDRLVLAVEAAQEAGRSGFAPTLILANLDRQTLLQARDSLCRSAAGGRRLLLSGLLSDQRADIEAAYAESGWYVRSARERDGWLALELTPAESCE